MVKFILKNERNIKFVKKFWFLKPFFIFDITRLAEIEDVDFFNQTISRLSNSNNTCKITYPGRFDTLNNLFSIFFQSKDEKISIHDVAVSSGITTVELFEWLHNDNYTFELFASDKFSSIEYYGNRIKYFYDVDGNLFQINFYNIFFGLRVSNYFFLSKLLFRWVKRFHDQSAPRKKIYLFDKKFNELSFQKKINFFEYDLFDNTCLEKSFDFIRVMNVLNLGYFSEEKILYALKKLIKVTNEDGIILIGRTTLSEIHHATFYRKKNGCLLPIHLVNGGYELNYLIQKLSDKPAPEVANFL